MIIGKHLVAQAIALITFSLPANAFGANEAGIDLTQAKRYATQHNHDIASLRRFMDVAAARQSRVDAAFRPTLGIAAGGEADVTEGESASGPAFYFYGTYNIFNGFRDTRRGEVAASESEKASIKLKTAEFLVGLEVEQYFQEYLLKKAQIELKDRSLARNDDHQAMVKRSRMAGAVSETDIMEFQLRDANLRSDIVALKQELEDARSNLKRLLGDGIGSSVEPIGSLPHQHVSGSLTDYLSRVERDSEAVRTAAHDVDIARTERKSVDGRWLPAVDLEARGGLLPLVSQLQRHRPQISVALIAKLDIYQGGDGTAEVREKEAMSLQAESALKAVINKTIRQVEIGYRSLKVLESRADLERNNVDFARRYYDSVIGEYRRGYKNSADVGNASDQLSATEERRILLDHQFIIQRIDVERALGSSIDIILVNDQEKGATK